MVAPAAIGLAGAGSLISGASALFGGQAQAGMYGYQSQVAQYNRAIALQNADYALATGEIQARNYGMGAAQRMGAIRAGEGASGIDVGSGSKADVQTSQQVVSDIDLAQIRNNAARKAYGYQVEATGDEAQAELYQRAAKTATTAGDIKALGSLVGGSTSVADKWLQGQSVGIFNSGDETLGA